MTKTEENIVRHTIAVLQAQLDAATRFEDRLRLESNIGYLKWVVDELPAQAKAQDEHFGLCTT